MNSGNKLLSVLNEAGVMIRKNNDGSFFSRKGIRCLVKVLSNVKDFRKKGMITYNLENLLAICLYISAKGELTSFLNIEDYVNVYRSKFRRLGLIGKDIPSHDTFRRLFMYLDADSLRDAILGKLKYFLSHFVKEDDKAKRLVILDGKEFNGSGRTIDGQNHGNINVMNIYDQSMGLMISSTTLPDKQSEIPEAQRLLRKLNLKKSVVSADALHCQKKTCEIVVNKKGEYVFPVKDNQRGLRQEIESCFSSNKYPVIKADTDELEVSVMILPKSYAGEEWPGQKSYTRMVSHKRDAHKESTPTVMYFISNSKDPELIAEVIDTRWNLEDGPHKFKDEFLNEDECSFADENAVKVMAIINDIIFGMYKLASSLDNDTLHRTKIRYKEDPIKLFRRIYPFLEGNDVAMLIRNAKKRKKRH